eukprot:scaffold25804_cov58-Attheya_sp.AAC.1
MKLLFIISSPRVETLIFFGIGLTVLIQVFLAVQIHWIDSISGRKISSPELTERDQAIHHDLYTQYRPSPWEIPLITGDKEPCALLFFGLPRGFADIVYPSIEEHVLKANPTCQIFVHSYNVTNAVEAQQSDSVPLNIHELQLLSRNSSGTRLDTEEYFQMKHDVNYYRQFYPNPSFGWTFPTSTDNMIRQWHSLHSVWNLLEQYEQRNSAIFKRVGLFRLDVHYTEPVNIKTKDAAVIPSLMFENTHWPRAVNDRLFFGDRHFAQVWASDRFSSVEGYLAWQKTTDSSNRGIHSEDFVAYLIKQKWNMPLKQQDICFQRVRSNGAIIVWDCDWMWRNKVKG